MDGTLSSARIEALLAHREWVRRVACVLTADEHVAADLEQDLWVEVLERPPKPRTSVRGWLATALRRDLLDRRKSGERRRRRERASARPEATRATGDLVAEADAQRRVIEAVMRLEEPYRTTVLLRWFDDLKPKEIAQRQGVPVDTVRTRLRRAIERLRQRLTEDVGGDRRAFLAALLPLAERAGRESTTVAAGTTTLFGVIVMTLKTRIALAAVVVLLLGGWFFLEHRSEERTTTGSSIASQPLESSEGPVLAPRSAAKEPAATRTEGQDAGDVEAENTLRVSCRIEGAAITAWYRVYGAGPDPESVVRTADARGAASLPIPQHPHLVNEAVVEGRAPGYATKVVRVNNLSKPVKLMMLRGNSVRGWVVDESGTPVAGATVSGGIEKVTTAKDGTFEVFWNAAKIWFKVTHPDFVAWKASGMIPAPSVGYEVRLSRGLSISGRVFFEDGRPAMGARVQLGESARWASPGRVAIAGPYGYYKLSGLARGSHGVLCRSGGSRWALTQDESRTVLAGAENVDFVLKSHVVHVRVVDEAGRPFRNVDLYWWGIWEDIDIMRGRIRSQDRAKSITLPRGLRFRACVRARGHACGMVETEVEGPAARHEAVITMRRLGPPGRIEVVARDASGVPLRKVRVTLKTIAGWPLMWFGGSRDFDLDPSGATVITDVPAQQIEAEISARFDPASETDFLIPFQKSFRLEDGGTERLEATLRRGGRLRVRVMDPDGKPAVFNLLRLRRAKGVVWPTIFWSRGKHGGWSSPASRGDEALAGVPIPPGAYEVEVLKQPHRGVFAVIGSAPVEIVEGQVAHAIVHLEK